MTSDDSIEPSGTWKFFVAFGILLLIIAAIPAYRAWDSQRIREEWTYNGFEFRQSAEGFWVTEVQIGSQPFIVPFHHHPSELEDIIVDANVARPILINTPREIVIAIHPDAGSRPVLGGVEIAKVTGQRYNLLNIPTRSALSAESNDSLDMEIVTCEDATNQTTVIQFIQTDQNALIAEGQCIFLLYKEPEDSIRVSDRLAYRLLRIMP